MRKLVLLGLMLLSGAYWAKAVGIPNPFVNEPGLAYSKRFTVNLSNAAVNTVTATAVYSSATFASSSFSTGQVSTGSFLVVDNTILSTAVATNQITVTSTSGVNGDALVITQLNKPGAFVLAAGRDWNYKATTALTAASIKTALDKIPFFATSRAGAVLYSTAAAAGTTYNGMLVNTNNTGSLTIAHANFTGGRDATVVSVNGYKFKAGVSFPVGPTAAATAGNLTSAINAKAFLSNDLTAATATSSVTVQSDKVGALYNFSLASSNPSAVSVLHPTLVGGANAGWALNSKNITLPAHGFTLALPVLYSTGTGSPAISGLVNQTTYYAIPVDANTVQLATSSAQAVLGVGAVLASSSTLTAAKNYTLAPLAWNAGSAGFDWEVSNDNLSWTRLDVASVTYSNSGSINWDLGQLNFTYLSLNVTGPTAGGLGLRVTAQGGFNP